MDQLQGGDQIQTQQQSPDRDSLTGKIMLSVIAALFAATLIVLFLHLYIRIHLFRRARRRRAALLLGSADPFHPLPLVPSGLDPDLLQSLPISIRSPSDDLIECTVCLSEVEEGEKLRILPKCRHGFHVDCIDMWFFNHTTCPLCRAVVEAPSPKLMIREICTSSSCEAMVGIEEPPRRFDDLGFGSPALMRVLTSNKRPWSHDGRFYNEPLSDADLEMGEGADPHPFPSPSHAPPPALAA